MKPKAPRGAATRAPSTDETASSQHAVLELAYRAAQRTAPSDFEVSVAVQRIRARMQLAPPRRRRRGPLLALALMCFGGLAFAAGQLAKSRPPAAPAVNEADRPPETSRTAPGTRAEIPKAAPATSSSEAATTPEAVTHSAAAPATDPNASTASQPHNGSSEQPAQLQTSGGHGARNLEGPQRRRAPAHSKSPGGAEPGIASWTEVAAALDQGDQQRAQSALLAMARTADPATRQQALLGLAQLAAGRKDCQNATRWSKQLEQLGATQTTLRRAGELIRNCRPR